MKYVLVLDVAKGKSMFMLSSDAGEVLIEPIEYQHNKTNFELIDSKINELNIKNNLTVVMEATSIYHKAPERFFKEHDYHTIVFNPLIGKETTTTIRKTKTDKQDCIKITNLFWTGNIPDRNYTEEEIYTKLNELSRQYHHLEEGLTRHKNRYKELVHLCFPEFELCFKDSKIYELTALNFIKEFPHAYIIKNKRVDALAYNLYGTTALICPLMDARRNQTYTGIYTFVQKEDIMEFEVVSEQKAVAIEEILEEVNSLANKKRTNVFFNKKDDTLSFYRLNKHTLFHNQC